MSASQAQSARSQYDLAFQVSPILLVNGIAATAQGGMIPIVTLTGGSTTNLDDAFAHYLPLPGSTLVSQAIAMYPFANQAVAANATIQQPLTISLAMIAPVNKPGGYTQKLAAFSNLQAQLTTHNASGGTYIIATPAFIYNNCLMTSMADITAEVSAEDGKQVQIQYQLDFIQPLLTLAGAQQAQNALMQKLTNGSRINGAPSWSGNQASSPATSPGITGALGNVIAAVTAFGGTL